VTLPRQGYFDDREHAAEQLAEALLAYRGRHPLVLAIPRGGVPIGRVLADRLDGDLDVVLVHKLGAPGQEEFAVGAIGEDGQVLVAAHAARAGADADYLRGEAAHQLDAIARRRQLYDPHREAFEVAGRIAIVVDDGLATGATMRAALIAVRALGPQSLVCAVPVASSRSLAELRPLCDDVVCPASPRDFGAVSQYYRDFPAVTDDEVVRLLTRLRAPAGGMQTVRIPADGVRLEGDLHVPEQARGLVVFAHGSGSSRFSPRNRQVAEELGKHGMATLLFDLLGAEEDIALASRFDIERLAGRLEAAVTWAMRLPSLARLPLGLFGASTGAAAALIAAAERPDRVTAVVCRGGRVDLAEDVLGEVRAPVLLIVGGRDPHVLALNRDAADRLTAPHRLEVVPGATHLFAEQHALETVALAARLWFTRPGPEPEPPAG